MNKKNKITKNQQNVGTPQKKELTIYGEKIEYYQGQLPHPDILDRLEIISPGITKELLHLVKEQTIHRIDIESKTVDSNISNSKKGLWFGFILALILILGSLYIILSGMPIIGSVFGGATIVTLVYLFTRTSKLRLMELERKKDKFMKK